MLNLDVAFQRGKFHVAGGQAVSTGEYKMSSFMVRLLKVICH